jgi:Lhr-like helicase
VLTSRLVSWCSGPPAATTSAAPLLAAQLLGEWYDAGYTLVFVDTKERADSLFLELTRAGYPTLSLHGGKDQADRDSTLAEFKAGTKRVLVATSVAGRGLDVPEITLVVNYAVPNHLEDYVHRVGRTGRAGRKGTAYTFITPEEEQVNMPVPTVACVRAVAEWCAAAAGPQSRALCVRRVSPRSAPLLSRRVSLTST